MADQNPPHRMPLSGERIAPRFDSFKPREIHKFWEDIETHFERSSIMDNERKPWVLRYVDSDTCDFWESFEEASSDEKTYEEFKAKINEYYPRVDGTRQHTTAELLTYIDQALSDSIWDKEKYATFAHGFMQKSQYLLKRIPPGPSMIILVPVLLFWPSPMYRCLLQMPWLPETRSRTR